MKTYQYIDIEADGGEWVPAEVAQGLYDALAYVERKAKEVEEDSVGEEDKDFHPWLAQARAALVSADGEDQ